MRELTINDRQSVPSALVFGQNNVLFSGHEDGTIRRWNLATTEQLLFLRIDKKKVQTLALSESQGVLIVGFSDGRLTAFDLKTTRPRWEVRVPEYTIVSLNVLPHESVVVCTLSDGIVDFLNTASGQTKGQWKCSATVDVAVVSPQGKYVALGDMDGGIVVRETATGNVVSSCTNFLAEPVGALAFSPVERQFVSGSGGRIDVWDAVSSRSVNDSGFPGSYRDFDLSPDGRLLAWAGHNTIGLWTVEDNHLIDQFSVQQNTRRVIFSPDGVALGLSSWDRTIRLVDLRNGSLTTVGQHSDQVDDICFSKDGRFVIACDNDYDDGSHVILWNLSGGGKKAEITSPKDSRKCEDFDELGDNMESVMSKSYGEWRACCLAASPEGNYVAVGGSGYNPKDGLSVLNYTPLRKLPSLIDAGGFDGHASLVYSVAFSPDGRFFATGSMDQTILVWNIASRLQQCCLKGHTGTINSVAISQRGTLLASGSDDGTVRLWDLSKGNLVRIFTGHSDKVQRVVFHPHSDLLFSGSLDNTVLVWDCRNYENIGEVTMN
jgi:WD40 repeat protein